MEEMGKKCIFYMLVGPAIVDGRRLTLHKQQVSSTATPHYRERRGVLMLLLRVSVFIRIALPPFGG